MIQLEGPFRARRPRMFRTEAITAAAWMAALLLTAAILAAIARRPMSTKMFKKLMCILTEKEQNVAAAEAAKLQLSAEILEEERKESAREYRTRKKDMHAEILALSKKAETGREERDVECEWRNSKLYRLDTNEVLTRRDLGGDDPQTEIGVDETVTDEEPKIAKGRESPKKRAKKSKLKNGEAQA